jgi:hypothetical protein
MLDWGLEVLRTSHVPRAQARQIAVMRVAAMLDRYAPETLLLPLAGFEGVRRSDHVIEVLAAIQSEAVRRGIQVHRLDPTTVRNGLALRFGTLPSNKTAIRDLLIQQYPQLSARSLRPRKPWQPEQYNTPLFDAIAMFLAWSRG